MKYIYPVILTPVEKGYIVSVPDLNVDTQGTDIADTLEMARDAIGLWGITQQDYGREIPVAENLKPYCEDDEITALVDIDFDEYRRKHDNRTVRRNIILPAWLDEAASKANINVSGLTQAALKEYLNIDRI